MPPTAEIIPTEPDRANTRGGIRLPELLCLLKVIRLWLLAMCIFPKGRININNAMYKRLPLSFSLLCLLALSCFWPFTIAKAQDSKTTSEATTLSGKLLSTSGEAIIGAKLYLPEVKLGTTTNAEGSFSITAKLPYPDSVWVQIAALGYERKTLRLATKGSISLNLNEAANAFEEVIVENTRADQNAPVSYSTLSKKEIEENFYGQDPTALLMNTPSINASFQAGNLMTNYSEIRLRGIDQSRINITLNGIPLNDMLDQGVFFSNFPDFGNSVQSIQVQRGVGTSANGVASYAGSINFESVKLDQAKPSAEVQLTTGSFNTQRFSTEVHTGLMENKWSFYGKYSGLQTDGYRYHSGSQGGSFFFSGGYFGKKDLLKITAFSGRINNELAYLPERLDLVRQDPRTNSLSRNQTDVFGQDLVSVQYTRFLSSQTNWTNSVYYGSAGGDFDVTDDLIFSLQNRHVGVISQVNHSSSDGRLNVSGGVQANTFLRENYASLNPLDKQRLYNNWGRKDEFSAFGKVSYQLGKLTAFGDVQVRYAGFTYLPDPNYQLPNYAINWTFLNPKAGLIYQLSPYLDAFASVGSTGREPTRRDMLSGADNITPANKDTTGNFSAVRPEYVTDYEAGFNFRGKKFSGQINYFYMAFRNEIAATGQYTSWGEVLRKNVASSYRQGVEFSLTYQPLESLRLINTSAVMDARISTYTTEGDGRTANNVRPLLTPAVIVAQQAIYNPAPWFNTGLTVRYVSESYLSNFNEEEFKAPAYVVSDLRVSFVYKKNYSLNLFANNLFDARYFNTGTVFNFGAGPQAYVFMQAPRNFMASVSLKF